MNSRCKTILQAYLDRHSPEKQNRLKRYLPEGTLPPVPSSTSPARLEQINLDIFGQVHWSWFLPMLKTYSEQEQACFLAALPSDIAENVSKSLKVPLGSILLTPIARSYFQQILQHSLIPYKTDLLPLAYLPFSTLHPLLHLSQKDFIRLLQLLGLTDLAVELRQIVETKILKKIYCFLTEEECKRLKEVSSYQQQTPPSSRLSLERWDEGEDSLRILLHRKGLARLSIALTNQDPDFIWYICHQLDIGRGSSLLKLCTNPLAPQLSESMVHEVEELIRNYL